MRDLVPHNKFYKAHPTHAHTHTHACMLALSCTQTRHIHIHVYLHSTYIHTPHVWLTNLSQSKLASVALVKLQINKCKLWYIPVFCMVRPPNHTDHTGEYICHTAYSLTHTCQFCVVRPPNWGGGGVGQMANKRH